jgi:hypothetical protein
MLRFTEFGLFLVPFALFVAWIVLGRRAQKELIWAAAAALVLLGGATMWFGVGHQLSRDAAYVPAQLENGRIVPGHGVEP